MVVVVVSTFVLLYLVVVGISVADVRMFIEAEGADVGLCDGEYDGKAVESKMGGFDGTFDGLLEGDDDGNLDGEFDGTKEGKDDGKVDGEMDGSADTAVGDLDGDVVEVVGGSVSAAYPLKKNPVNNKPFTY